MEATFHLNAKEFNIGFLSTISPLLDGAEELTLIVKNPIQNGPDPEKIIKGFEDLRKKYGVKKISPDIDISELANEVNDPS